MSWKQPSWKSERNAAVLAATAEQHIAYVPYFPLGGFSPLQSDVLESVAKRLGVTPTAVAQSWLLQHAPNIMLIPGTSSVTHLRENIAGAALTLPADAVAELDAILAQSRTSFSASLGTAKDARKIGKNLFPVHRNATISSPAASKV